MTTHRITGEQPIGHLDGTWHYEIACNCPDVIEAGPLPSEQMAKDEAHRRWQAHLMDRP